MIQKKSVSLKGATRFYSFCVAANFLWSGNSTPLQSPVQESSLSTSHWGFPSFLKCELNIII